MVPYQKRHNSAQSQRLIEPIQVTHNKTFYEQMSLRSRSTWILLESRKSVAGKGSTRATAEEGCPSGLVIREETIECLRALEFRSRILCIFREHSSGTYLFLPSECLSSKYKDITKDKDKTKSDGMKKG